MSPRTDDEELDIMITNHHPSTAITTSTRASCPVSPASHVVTPESSQKGGVHVVDALSIDITSRSSSSWMSTENESLPPTPPVFTTMTNDNLSIQVLKSIQLTGHSSKAKDKTVTVKIDRVSHTIQNTGLEYGRASICLQLLLNENKEKDSSKKQVRFFPKHDNIHNHNHGTESNEQIQVLEAQCIQLNSASPLYTTNVDIYTSNEYGSNKTTVMLHFPTYETTKSSSPPLVQIELALA
mmetsp:Transcript_15011/g.21246  ORF Transcript_15011/g.21246 Transcript_15011/m.21246 type:complete len:239 (+) Transcript_15011:240-956(+)